jgi:hypothetical protein
VALAIVFRESTSEMLRKQFWLWLLFVLAAAGTPCFAQQTNAVLFKRYDRGGSVNRIIEDTFSLKIDVKPQDKAIVAVRVCSKDRLPFALVTANADPFFITQQLVNAYAYAPERLVFLRSEDCLGKVSSAGITEIWTLSQGASFPPYIEKVAFTDAQRVALGKKPVFRGVRDYREALAGLIKELQANPAARGLVIGYYEFNGRLNSVLRRRLKEVTTIFERSGLPRDRYLVHVTHANDESWESQPKALYPEVYIIRKVD